MNKKITAILAVTVMVFASLVAFIPDGSDAEPTDPVTVHPTPGDRMPWVTKNPIPYYNGQSLYFTEDPYDEIVKFLNSEITLDELKTKCGYTSSQPPSGVYYETYFHSGNTRLNLNYTYNRYINVMEPVHLYFAQDPYNDAVSYINKLITLDELKTRDGYSETPSDYEFIYNEGSDWAYIQGFAYHSIQVNGRYQGVGNLFFTEDPYSEVVKYNNGEIDIETLKTKCGYRETWTTEVPLYRVDYNGGGRVSIHYSTTREMNAGQLAVQGEAYFTADPYTEVIKYINGEIDLATLKTKCGFTKRSSLIDGNSYYNISISGSWSGDSSVSNYVRYIEVQPNYIFLQKGEYHLNITDTDLTRVAINALNKNARYDDIEIENRTGSTDITVSSSDAIWFTNNSNNWDTSLENTWREKNITYTLDPAPTSGPEVTTFENTIKVLPDKEWVKATTVDNLTGTYSLQNRYIMFIAGSDEEKTFIEDVIDKGLMDGSGYGYSKITVNGEKLVFYACRETSSYIPTNIWLNDESQTYNPGVSFEIKTEKLSVSDVDPYKFYAKYDFAISVKYDTTKVKAVVMMYPNIYGNTEYSVLESEKLYEYHQVSAAEYELYAIPVASSSATLAPVDIEIHTENVASPDENGMIFAGVAIVLCAMAFCILFLSGRRPKWNEMTGLPSADTEIVRNEVPEVAAEEENPAETSAEEPPKE